MLRDELVKLINEWNEEADFLLNNSVGSDITAGNTYKECADKLTKTLAELEESNG